MVVWQEGGGGGSCKVQILLEDGWKACQLGCTRQTICAPGKSKEYFPIVIQKSIHAQRPLTVTHQPVNSVRKNTIHIIYVHLFIQM